MTGHAALNAIGYGLGVAQAERVRQVTAHDWTPEHDDQYVNGELVTYANYWLTGPQEKEVRRDHIARLQSVGSPGWDYVWFKYDERTPEQRLARAAALICAEIDRQYRAAKKAEALPAQE